MLATHNEANREERQQPQKNKMLHNIDPIQPMSLLPLQVQDGIIP